MGAGGGCGFKRASWGISFGTKNIFYLVHIVATIVLIVILYCPFTRYCNWGENLCKGHMKMLVLKAAWKSMILK